MIHLINVTKTFEPKTVALKNINLHIEPGEFISIVGQSGSGKTTIARLLIAEIRPDKGKIVVGGWNITGIKHRQIPLLRRQIGGEAVGSLAAAEPGEEALFFSLFFYLRSGPVQKGQTELFLEVS